MINRERAQASTNIRASIYIHYEQAHKHTSKQEQAYKHTSIRASNHKHTSMTSEQVYKHTRASIQAPIQAYKHTRASIQAYERSKRASIQAYYTSKRTSIQSYKHTSIRPSIQAYERAYEQEHKHILYTSIQKQAYKHTSNEQASTRIRTSEQAYKCTSIQAYEQASTRM
jgi:hypothetical protein